MKVIFLPEEQDEFTIYSHAQDFYAVLCELDNWLRHKIKYEERKEYQVIRDELNRLMNEKNVYIGIVE